MDKARREKPTCSARIDGYEVVARALEAGIARGVKRGRRSKAKGGLEDAIFRAAMDELAQVLRWDA